MKRLSIPQRVLTATCLLASTCCAHAESNSTTQAIEQAVRAHLIKLAQPHAAEVLVTPPPADPRRGSCERIEVALSGAQKAWGRVLTSVRCTKGPSWALFVRAEVRFAGRWVSLNRAVLAGQEIPPDALGLTQGQLSDQSPDVLTDPAQAAGQFARTTLRAGTALRNAHLRAPEAVRAGQMVRLLSGGTGFAVSNEGQAINAAAVGQLVRVRLGNGRVLSGIARSPGVVEIPN